MALEPVILRFAATVFLTPVQRIAILQSQLLEPVTTLPVHVYTVSQTE